MSGTAPTPRKPFTFADATMPAADCQARALEFVAHYLEGIDKSLATISREVAPIKKASGMETLTEGLAFQLQRLVEAVNRK